MAVGQFCSSWKAKGGMVTTGGASPMIVASPRSASIVPAEGWFPRDRRRFG